MLRAHSKSLSFVFSVTGFAVLTAAALFGWKYLETRELDRVQAELKREAQKIKLQLAQNFTEKLRAVSRLARRGEQLTPASMTAWNNDIRQYLRDGVFAGLQRVDARWMARQDSRLRAALLSARRGRMLAVIHDPADGKGFQILFPLLRKGREDGLLIVRFNYFEFLDSILPDALVAGYSAQLFDGSQTLISKGGVASREAGSVELSLPLHPNLSWKLRVSPTTSRLAEMRSPLPKLALIFGIVLALLVTLMLELLGRLSARMQYAESMTKKFSAVAETANDAIIVANAAGMVTYFNHAAEEIFGYPRDQAMGMPLSALMPERFRAAHKQGFTRFLSAGERKVIGKTVELVALRKDGSEIPVELSIASWKSGSLPSFTAVIRDIGERKKTEVLLRQSEAKMLESARLSSLGELASGVAHEITSPITVIVARASQLKQMVEHGKLDRAKLKLFTEKIELTAERIARVVQGMRSLAREENEEPIVSTGLRAITEETADLCRERAHYLGIRLELGDIDDALEIPCQSARVRRILLDLINNAVHAVEESPEKWIRLDVSESPSEICFRVSDSGAGVPPQMKAKIFEPFFTGWGRGDGSGLGLSISFALAKAQGGELFLDEKAPHTTFVLRLPRPAAEAPLLAAA